MVPPGLDVPHLVRLITPLPARTLPSTSSTSGTTTPIQIFASRTFGSQQPQLLLRLFGQVVDVEASTHAHLALGDAIIILVPVRILI